MNHFFRLEAYTLPDTPTFLLCRFAPLILVSRRIWCDSDSLLSFYFLELRIWLLAWTISRHNLNGKILHVLPKFSCYFNIFLSMASSVLTIYSQRAQYLPNKHRFEEACDYIFRLILTTEIVGGWLAYYWAYQNLCRQHCSLSHVILYVQ